MSKKYFLIFKNGFRTLYFFLFVYLRMFVLARLLVLSQLKAFGPTTWIFGSSVTF